MGSAFGTLIIWQPAGENRGLTTSQQLNRVTDPEKGELKHQDPRAGQGRPHQREEGDADGGGRDADGCGCGRMGKHEQTSET